MSLFFSYPSCKPEQRTPWLFGLLCLATPALLLATTIKQQTADYVIYATGIETRYDAQAYWVDNETLGDTRTQVES